MGDALIERIEKARSDADWAFAKGSERGVSECVILTRADCDEIAAIFTKAFGLALMGKLDPVLADMLALVGAAFAGDADHNGEDDE